MTSITTINRTFNVKESYYKVLSLISQNSFAELTEAVTYYEEFPDFTQTYTYKKVTIQTKHIIEITE